MRHASGKASRAVIGGGSSVLPPAAVEDEAALLEGADSDARRAPRSSSRAISRAGTGVVSKVAPRCPSASASCVPEPSPACAGIASSMVTRTGGRLHSSRAGPASPGTARPRPRPRPWRMRRARRESGRDALDRQARAAETTARARPRDRGSQGGAAPAPRRERSLLSPWSGSDPLTATSARSTAPTPADDRPPRCDARLGRGRRPHSSRGGIAVVARVHRCRCPPAATAAA